jgi:hypothetical protein
LQKIRVKERLFTCAVLSRYGALSNHFRCEGQSMSEELNPVMDYDEHNKTYNMFVNLTKWGTIALVLLLIVMAATLL